METKNPLPVSVAQQRRKQLAAKEAEIENLKRQLALADEANVQFMEYVMLRLPPA
jgi:hypothetical protein